MTKRAVIFDLDGVLVDSEPQYLEFFRQFLLQNGCVPQEEGLRATVGSSNYETWRQLALMWSDPLIPPLELERIYLHQCGHLAIDYQASLFPGVLQLVQRLQRGGLVLAIASSSPCLPSGECWNRPDLTPTSLMWSAAICSVAANLIQKSTSMPSLLLGFPQNNAWQWRTPPMVFSPPNAQDWRW